MYCRNCGNQIDDKAMACPSCGVQVNNGKKFCQNCGAESAENAYVCVKCGVKLGGNNMFVNTTPSGKKQVNWLVCLLLSIFLGGIAVDRFIMGHVGLGILKILTCGGCGIWYIIDIILIATKYNFKDVEWIDTVS
jgi:TM2 domain-containing membrane protein YozV